MAQEASYTASAESYPSVSKQLVRQALKCVSCSLMFLLSTNIEDSSSLIAVQ